MNMVYMVVIKCNMRSNMGIKKGFPLHYYFILYNSSPREVRLGGQWQELMYRWRKAEYWLTLYGLLILNNSE